MRLTAFLSDCSWITLLGSKYLLTAALLSKLTRYRFFGSSWRSQVWRVK
jgi:hypothetical protein